MGMRSQILFEILLFQLLFSETYHFRLKASQNGVINIQKELEVVDDNPWNPILNTSSSPSLAYSSRLSNSSSTIISSTTSSLTISSTSRNYASNATSISRNISSTSVGYGGWTKPSNFSNATKQSNTATTPTMPMSNTTWTTAAQSTVPNGPTTNNGTGTIISDNKAAISISLGVFGVLVMAALVIALAYFWFRKRKSRRNRDIIVQRSRLLELEEELKRSREAHEALSLRHASQDHVDMGGDMWEHPRDRLQIHTFDVLGRGAFGHVYKVKAILLKPTTLTEHASVDGSAPAVFIRSESQAASHEIVAVKVLAETASHSDRESFRAEIELMKELGCHPHVLRLVGAITASLPYCLALEYCADGNLLRLLREKRPSSAEETPALALKELYAFAWQIADGLDYIASRGFVHRDVAARNVLISSGLVAKVSDFGLSRRVGCADAAYSFSSGRLPVKWMAMESLRDNVATTESDVWSYGVLLFEIISLEQAPYPLIAPGHLLDYLDRGGRLQKSKGCPDEYYALMQSCWQKDPMSRPKFSDLKRSCASLLETNTSPDYNYVDLMAAQYNYFDVSEMKVKADPHIANPVSDINHRDSQDAENSGESDPSPPPLVKQSRMHF